MDSLKVSDLKVSDVPAPPLEIQTSELIAQSIPTRMSPIELPHGLDASSMEPSSMDSIEPSPVDGELIGQATLTGAAVLLADVVGSMQSMTSCLRDASANQDPCNLAAKQDAIALSKAILVRMASGLSSPRTPKLLSPTTTWPEDWWLSASGKSSPCGSPSPLSRAASGIGPSLFNGPNGVQPGGPPIPPIAPGLENNPDMLVLAARTELENLVSEARRERELENRELNKAEAANLEPESLQNPEQPSRTVSFGNDFSSNKAVSFGNEFSASANQAFAHFANALQDTINEAYALQEDSPYIMRNANEDESTKSEIHSDQEERRMEADRTAMYSKFNGLPSLNGWSSGPMQLARRPKQKNKKKYWSNVKSAQGRPKFWREESK